MRPDCEHGGLEQVRGDPHAWQVPPTTQYRCRRWTRAARSQSQRSRRSGCTASHHPPARSSCTHEARSRAWSACGSTRGSSSTRCCAPSRSRRTRKLLSFDNSARMPMISPIAPCVCHHVYNRGVDVGRGARLPLRSAACQRGYRNDSKLIVTCRDDCGHYGAGVRERARERQGGSHLSHLRAHDRRGLPRAQHGQRRQGQGQLRLAHCRSPAKRRSRNCCFK